MAITRRAQLQPADASEYARARRHTHTHTHTHTLEYATPALVLRNRRLPCRQPRQGHPTLLTTRRTYCAVDAYSVWLCISITAQMPDGYRNPTQETGTGGAERDGTRPKTEDEDAMRRERREQKRAAEQRTGARPPSRQRAARRFRVERAACMHILFRDTCCIGVHYF